MITMFSIARNILKVETKLHNVNCYRQLNTTPQRFSNLLLVHRDSEENNTKIPFQFTEANMKRISALVQNFPKGSQRSAIAMVMDIVQRQIGWIPISAQHKVAELLSIPRMRVYEWVTFYSMCKRTYKGKFHVKVCMTLPCMLRGSEIILQAVEQATCCKAECLSEDKMFGLDVVECQAACVNAPVMVINDDYYEDLNVCDVFNIIRTLKCGGIPPFGPQSYKGKFHVKVCMTLPCMLRGSEIILQAVEQATCCKAECLSEDKMFGLDVVECQGACVNAPVMVINDDYYEDLNVCDVFNIIRTLKCGGIPPFGPQASRYAAEPFTGLTSLTECPPGPGYKMQACFTQCERK